MDENRLWMKCFVADDRSSAVGLLPVALRAEHLAVIGNSPSALGPWLDVVGLHVLLKMHAILQNRRHGNILIISIYNHVK